MKINVHQTIKALDGEDNLTYTGETATVGLLSQKALTKTGSDNYEKKINLAKKFMTAGDTISLKSEEITLIKNSLKQLPVTAELIYQFEQLIDPVEESSTENKEEDQEKKEK